HAECGLPDAPGRHRPDAGRPRGDVRADGGRKPVRVDPHLSAGALPPEVARRWADAGEREVAGLSAGLLRDPLRLLRLLRYSWIVSRMAGSVEEGSRAWCRGF